MGDRLATIGLTLLFATVTTGCGQQQANAPALVAPTVASIFSAPSPQQATPIPTLPPTARPAPTASLAPTVAASTTSTVVTQTFDLQVYDEALAPGWTLRSSDGVEYNSTSDTFAYESELSVEARPTRAYSSLIFGVARSTPRNYKRKDVVGVRFRVSGGEAILPTDGLIVTVYGSKKFPYFVPGDVSATVPEGRVEAEEPLFPETRLFFLDINRAIAPGEWAEVVVWLDDHFTPDYRYVTGIQIKNDEGYLDPFYVDDVALIMRQP